MHHSANKKTIPFNNKKRLKILLGARNCANRANDKQDARRARNG